MTLASASSEPLVVDSLRRAAARHPWAPKLLVAPQFGVGRELLRALARSGSGWIGFEVTTPRPLALRIGGPALRAAGLAPVDPFDEIELLEEALDGVLAAEVWPDVEELGEGAGFREQVHGSLIALRLAGVTPARLSDAGPANRMKSRFLAEALARYEEGLAARGGADTAAIYAAALSVLERVPEEEGLEGTAGAPVVLLAPGLGRRGLGGRLLAALEARGAEPLEHDPVRGIDVPATVVWRDGAEAGPLGHLHAPEDAPGEARVELFHASSLTEELREVLRRSAERGLSWDQVEIVTLDPARYGSALHSLATRLGVRVSYAVGLPLERTRTGRVLHTYLDWIEGGFQASPLRRLLESGDLRPPNGAEEPVAADLARRFRSLRIGWGRARYARQIGDAIEGLGRMRQSARESESRFERRRETRRIELEAIRDIVLPVLEATPGVPDRVGEEGPPISASELAAGLATFLARAPVETGPDGRAREQVLRILDRVRATLTRRTRFPSAVAALRRHVSIRVAAHGADAGPDDTGAPWSSAGGHLHLADLEHAGYSGREALFVVGADAERLPGPEKQDPLLLDGERARLSDELPRARDLVRERSFRFAAFCARARGSVTLSYAAWDATEARAVAPSSAMLQALRLARRDASATFEDLREALGPVASAVVSARRPALDVDDVWMAALGEGGVLREGVLAVCAAFPGLGAGVEARDVRAKGIPGPFHGVVSMEGRDLDPRGSPDHPVSASGLEKLGACPLLYLHRSVLRAYPPEDWELDPDAWLNPLVRGSLLHDVFERTLRGAREARVEHASESFEALALEELSRGLRRTRAEVPAPGDGVVRREVAALEADVRSFVRMVREHGAPWVALELRFGVEGEEPLTVPLAGGEIRVRGAIDRVDERDGGLRVIDYKTGGMHGFDKGTHTFRGGRRLQHAIYALAAEQRLGRAVEAGEYHFPTTRGLNELVPYPRLSLAPVGELLDTMLEGVASGWFLPTDDPDDCKFCDYAEVCRARTDDYGKVSSPPAEWSRECMGVGVWEHFGRLRAVRDFES